MLKQQSSSIRVIMITMLSVLVVSVGFVPTAYSELKGSFEFFSMKPEIVDICNTIAEEFMEQNPGVQVEVITIPEAAQVLIMRTQAGEAPDVHTDWPLNPNYRMFSKEGFNLDLSGEPFLGNVNKEILDMTAYEGKYYALPISLNFTGVYYNKDIFAELGLAIPETYSELVQAMQTIKAAGITPMMVSDKAPWTLGAFGDRAMGLIFDDKGELFESVAKGETSCLESEGLRRVAEIMLEIREYAQDDYLGTAYDQAIADFSNGKAAMFYQGTWAYPVIKKANPEMNLGCFPFPAETKEATRIGVNIDQALCISSSTKKVELAKAFLEFFSRTEIAQIYADMDGSPSAIKGVKSRTEEFELLTQLVDQGKSFRISRTYWANGVIGDLNMNLQKLVATKDVDQFLKDMDDVVKIYYAQ